MKKVQKSTEKHNSEIAPSIPEETRKKIAAFDKNEHAKRMTKRPQ